MCSSVYIRFPCAYVADIRGLTAALSSKTRAASARRSNRNRKRFGSTSPRTNTCYGAEVTAIRWCKNTGIIACGARPASSQELPLPANLVSPSRGYQAVVLNLGLIQGVMHSGNEFFSSLVFLDGDVILDAMSLGGLGFIGSGVRNQRAGGAFEGFALARFSKLKRSLSVERTSVASFVSTLR